MLNPAIRQLIGAYANRYQLVLDVAKCARDISEDAEEQKDILLDKPVTIAMNLMASKGASSATA